MHDMDLWDKNDDPRKLAQAGVEVWTEVPGTAGDYYVSNLGRYYSTATHRVLRGSQASTGYILYPCGRTSEKKSRVAHRLVLHAFDGPPPTDEHTDGRHLDGCKSNNALHNLLWGTRSENMRDVWRAKAAGAVASTTDSKPVPNPTYSLDEGAVQTGIRVFERGVISLRELSQLWSCSPEVARRALTGETWSHLERDVKLIERHLGRTGDRHHKAKVSDEALHEALELYVHHRWSGVRFAKFLGISQITAHSILSGRTRKGVGRPEGFQYPWPDARVRGRRCGSKHHATSLTEQDIEAAFSGVMAGQIGSVRELGEHLGLSKSATYALVKGKTWRDVARPAGLQDALRQRG